MNVYIKRAVRASVGLMRLVGFVIAVLITLIAGPIVEGKLFPVVSNIQQVNVFNDNKHIDVSFFGDKNRACKYEAVSALVRQNKEWVPAEVRFTETSQPTTRPVGNSQHFGLWHISKAGDGLIITVTHSCHVLWQTVTPLIKWEKQ